MIYPVVSIRDCKTGFMAPTLDINLDSAARSFLHSISRSADVISANPADFALYHIADFDTDSGLLTPVVPCVHIMDATAAFKVGDGNG